VKGLKQGQGAVLAPKKEEYYPKVQSEPQLGGEGSGFPPRFYIACGQHNRTVLGIDLGSQFMRVSSLEQDNFATLISPTSTTLALNHTGIWGLNSGLTGTAPPSAERVKNIVQSLRTKLGSTWSKDFDGETLGAEDLTRIQIQQLVTLARARAKSSLRDAVITVPASYTSMERKLIKRLAEECGLSVIQLINEPTAAVLANCMQYDQEDGCGIIFHMGACTSAATVYCLSNGILEIKATVSDGNFGGQNFDQILVQYLIDCFVEMYGRKPFIDEKTILQFEHAASKLKHDFIMTSEAFFNLPTVLFAGPEGGYARLSAGDMESFRGSITRNQFDYLCQSLIEKAIEQIEKAIGQSQLDRLQIKKIILTGGATQLPALRTALGEVAGISELERLEDDMMPSKGAAMQAALICQTTKELVVWDLLTQPVFISTSGGSTVQLIAANTPLPVTAYARLEIIDNTINARLIQGEERQYQTYTDIVINNCPPCSNGENKVELAVRVSQDGIINYGARHIGLDVALLVCPLQDERRQYQGDLDHLLSSSGGIKSGQRARKLSLNLNVPQHFLAQALMAMAYSPEQIVSGQAVELALRKIKVERRQHRLKNKSKQNEDC